MFLMKKVFSFFLSFVIIISSLSVLSSANYDVTIVSVSVLSDCVFLENFDSTESADYDGETNSMSQAYQYYDLYDADPVLSLEYSDGTQSTCLLSSVPYELGVYPVIESDQSHSNPWGAGEHEFTLIINDVSCSVNVVIEPCPYESVSIDDNGGLFITLTHKNGNKETYEADSFTNSFISEIGSDVGYLYTKQGRAFRCVVKYYTQQVSETQLISDRTRDFSLVFGAYESNIISGAEWYDDYFKKTEILSSAVSSGLVSFDSSNPGDNYADIAAATLNAKYFYSNDPVNSGIYANYGELTLTVSADADILKEAMSESFGIDNPDFEKLKDCYDSAGGLYVFKNDKYDPTLVPDISTSKKTDDGTVYYFVILHYPTDGGIYPEISDTYYAYFNSDGALIRITNSNPDAPVDALAVRPGFDFVFIDDATSIIYVSPLSSQMTVGELTNAFDRYVDTKCDESSYVWNGMLFECVTRSYLVVLFGDLDSNGKITASDARNALRISAKLISPAETAVYAGDLNRDGNVSAKEARAILRFAAKLDKTPGV